jgi:CheY-like chemotaxis protein
MKRIAIIEDEALIRKSISLFLERLGYNTYTFSNGKDALEFLEKNKVDRIISDIMLTDITGLEVFEELKKWYDEQDLIAMFIFITAYSNNQIVSHLKSFGCTIISKPFSSLEVFKQYLGDIS